MDVIESQPAPAPPVATPWPYGGVAGHFDELLDPSSGVRPPWSRLVSSLAAMGGEELERRWDQGRRLIHENGVTYNVYGDPRGMQRPWQLDPLPLVISSADWEHIEQAIAQRATVFNHMLADLYGQQRLLREGLLPPELVYANPGFLRPARGINVPRSIWLHVYAADIARAPNGQWWVVNDRTQAPSGAGYALENRLVITRCLPDIVRECQVHRLADFFARVRELLFDLAPAHKDNPRVVLLTPGPYNETYFEHAYLARYLGYTLVEGSDLTVRHDRVFLKTLSGLLPVDVILRRQDDSFCDPLELRDDSMLGVSGLMQCVRQGNVAVVNAQGSGVVETPGLMAFLPALCKTLLGEELKMPSVATWWCGQAAALQQVKGQIDGLVVKQTFPGPTSSVIFGEQLDARGRQNLFARMEARAHHFVAQERVALSTAPGWIDGTWAPRHLMVRVFAVATPDGSYRVMPGGLTRVSGSQDSTVVSMQGGGGSKDTWVLSDSPVPHFSLMRPPGQALELSRAGFVLSSRVADDLYWLGRYVERVDFTVRVARCALNRIADESDLNDVSVLPGLMDILLAQGRLLGGIDAPASDDDLFALGQQVLSVVFDEERPFSLRGDVVKVHRIAARVRDRISLDAWRVLGQVQDKCVKPAMPPAVLVNVTLELLDELIVILGAFGGQVMEDMTREMGWRFLDIGRRMERAQSLLSLLRVGLGRADETENQRLQAVLEIASSTMTYRSRYMAAPQPGPVLDLLLLDESIPRSLAFQLVALEDHVSRLTATPTPTRRPREQRLAIGVLTSTRLAEIESLIAAAPDGQRAALLQLFDSIDAEVKELSAELSRRYLSHAHRTQHMTGLSGERPS